MIEAKDTQHVSVVWLLDLLAMIALLLLVAAVFYKTVLWGVPVSRITKLAHWDSFFFDQAQGMNISLDPTTLLLYIPFYFLVALIWGGGVIPLWNPLSGCGSPLVGDIESGILSPWKLLFALHPGLETYNRILVSEIACAAIGTYLLARLLQLPRLSSLFAAVTFCLCPYILYYSELTTGSACCFLPFIFAAFALLACSVNAGSIIFAAFTSTVLIFSAHPESAFFGIIGGCLLAFFLRLFNVYGNTEFPLWKSLLNLCCGIALTGLLTFSFSAPVTFPFLEYLRNSDCYKFSTAGSAYVNWQSVLSCLLAPGCGGASPYLGVAILPLLSIGLFKGSALWRALLLSALVMFITVTQVGPVNNLFAHSVLAAVMTIYCLPAFLLVLSLLAAYGLHCLYKDTDKPYFILIIAAFASLLQVGLTVFVRSHTRGLTSLQFDSAIPYVISLLSLQIIVLCSLALIVVLFSRRLGIFAGVRTCCLIAVSLLSMSPAIALSLPAESHFIYELKEPLLGIDFTNNRLTSLGEHLFRPDTNWVFGISDLRCIKSLTPARYASFMRACGAQVDSHTQIFNQTPTHAFDFAAVPYVLTQLPLIDDKNTNGLAIEPPDTASAQQQSVIADLLLLSNQFSYLPDDYALAGDLHWQYEGKDCTADSPTPYKVMFLLSSTDGRALWFSDYYDLCPHVTLPVPMSLPEGSGVVVSMRVIDHKTNQLIKELPCGSFQILKANTQSEGRFSLLKEDGSNSGNIVRLYRNQHALPQAYIVHNVIPASGPDNALSLITTGTFSPATVAVVETPFIPTGIATTTDGVVLAPSLEDRQDNLNLQRPNANSVEINVSTTAPGLVVLNDTYYPGWEAFVDGKPTSILRCNYLFRGVFITEGTHKIKFVYLPASFIVGAVLASCAALILIIWLVIRLWPRKVADGQTAGDSLAKNSRG
jgi:hypothetical protein